MPHLATSYKQHPSSEIRTEDEDEGYLDDLAEEEDADESIEKVQNKDEQDEEEQDDIEGDELSNDAQQGEDDKPANTRRRISLKPQKPRAKLNAAR